MRKINQMQYLHLYELTVVCIIISDHPPMMNLSNTRVLLPCLRVHTWTRVAFQQATWHLTGKLSSYLQRRVVVNSLS